MTTRAHGIAQMRVRLRLFAKAREVCGFEQKDLTVSEGITVGDLFLEIGKAHPGFAAMADRILFAVNNEYCSPDAVLSDGDTIAMFPPVSGG